MNTRLTTLLLAAASLAAPLALAGPLDPPAGPVTSTMKTLVEVEPRTAITDANTPGNAGAMFVISQPGSYYLTGNVIATTGKACILVTANHATIDLNGFGLTADTDGIVLSSDGHFTIRNGVITGGTGSGIKGTTDLAQATVEDVTVQWVNTSGFSFSIGSTFRRCAARHCEPGFLVGTNSVLEDCIASQCYTTGFQLGAFSTATDCTSEWIFSGNGFQTDASCKLRYCRADSCDLNGFLGTETKYESCESIDNGQRGFDIGSGSTVINSSARRNSTQGLRAVDHNTITGCQFRDNNAGPNSYAGLWLAGSFNHVDRCESSTNGYGFYVNVGTTQNVITRSRASANPTSNFFLQPSNQVAPVVQNPGNNAYATMIPWSNLTY
jgi:hypothetical protein